MTPLATRAFAAALTVLTISLPLGAGAGHAAPPPQNQRCVVDDDDNDKTVDALMNHCSSEQILDLFAAAPLGVAPAGRKTLSLLPVFQIRGKKLDDVARTLTRTQSNLGDSLTFTTRGQTRWVYKDYVFGQDLGGPLRQSVSRLDGRPVWSVDFSRDFLGAQVSLHEYRQLTPGVWIGRDIGGGSGPTDTPTGGAIALS